MTEKPVRVAVVDDHPLFRRGIMSLLSTLEEVTVAGDAGSIAGALTVLEEQRPDVVLMDLDLGEESGIDATREIVSRWPDMAVLVLTMLGDDHSLFAAMRAGARGYLLKVASPTEVERAVRAVAAGQLLLGADVANRAAAYFSGTFATSSHPFPELTERERDVLELVAKGHDNGTIARTLFLSPKTVRNYVHAVMTKVGANDRSSLIVRARQAGIGTAAPS